MKELTESSAPSPRSGGPKIILLNAQVPTDGALVSREQRMLRFVFLITHTMARTRPAGKRDSENLYSLIYSFTFLRLLSLRAAFGLSIFLNVFRAGTSGTHQSFSMFWP